MVIFDEHLPLAWGQLVTAYSQLAVRADVALLTGPPEHVGTGVGGVGEHGMNRMIGGLHPGDLGGVQIAGRLQRELQVLLP